MVHIYNQGRTFIMNCVSNTNMVCLSDLPLDIIKEIVDNLQDDLPTLKASAQTCLSLSLPCSKYIFRTVILNSRRESMTRRSFANLLDGNPQIVDYVRNLVYLPQHSRNMDNLDCHVLDKFHRIQSFQLNCDGFSLHASWSELGPRLRESLSRIIHSVTQLVISYIKNFPISIFIPCINLIELKLNATQCIVDDINSYGHEYFAHDAVPQHQSLTLNGDSAVALMTLVDARRFEHIPVLDFSNLRRLSINILFNSELIGVHALLKVTQKLETLSYQYTGMYPIYLHFICWN